MPLRVTSAGLDVLRRGERRARVTSVGVDALLPDTPALEYEVTGVAVQVAHTIEGDIDTTFTQEGVEAIVGGDATHEATQVGVEAITGGDATHEVTQEGVEVVWRGAIFPGCDSESVFYRVRIRLQGALEDIAQYTSLPSGENSVLISEPRIDASTIDVLKGEATIGGCTVQLADPDEGTLLAPTPATRRFTKILADAEAQSQLIGARLFIEATDNPSPDEADWMAYWGGYIASVRFIDAITVEITGAHSTRDDSTTMVWRERTAAFNITGHVMAGPTLVDWPSSKPEQRLAGFQGDWWAEATVVTPTYVEFDIDEDRSANFAGSGQGGSFPPEDVRPYLKDRGLFRVSNNDTQRNTFKWAERNVQPYFAKGGPSSAVTAAWEAAGTYGWFPRLRCFVRTIGPSLVGREYPVMAAPRTVEYEGFQPIVRTSKLYEDLGNKFRLYWPSTDPFPQPTVGQLMRFQVRALDISEANPLLISMHPVDILTFLWDEQGIDYDAASALAAKEALGNFVVALRITEPMSLKDAQTMVCGGFGLGWRYAANGLRYVFTTRVRPAVTGRITLDDLVNDEGVVWEVDETSRVFSASYKWKRFSVWPGEEDGSNADRAFDGVMAYDVGPIVFQTADLDNKPFGSRDEQYDIPGSVYALEGGDVAPSWSIANHVDITANLTAPILEQFGRGAITTTLNLNHCVLVQEGEDWELELPHRPGFDALQSPIAQRGIVERVQCISRTPHPWGSTCTFVRVALVEEGDDDIVVVPTTPGVATAQPLSLGFVVHDATATGGTVVDETQIDDTFNAFVYANTFALLANDSANYSAMGVSVFVDYYVGPAAPMEGAEVRYSGSWDGLGQLSINGSEVGFFQVTDTVWYRTQVRLNNGFVFPFSAYTSIQFNGFVQTTPPTVSLTPDVSWNVDAQIVAPPSTAKLYVAADTTTYPDEATTLLATPVVGASASLAAVIPTLAEGETAYVTAIAEDALGNRSIVSTSFFTRPGGGSGGGGGPSTPLYTKYDPFCPPAAPSALDDEFDVDATGVPSGWTDVGPVSPLAGTEKRLGALDLRCPASASFNGVALEKTLPSGSFTIATHVTQLSRGAFSNGGIYLRSSVSGRVLDISMYVDTGSPGDVRLIVQKWTSFTSRSSLSLWQVLEMDMFLRLHYDGTTLVADYSRNGKQWTEGLSEAISTHFTGGDLPDRVGMSLRSESANIGRMAFEFFRYFPTANADIGRNVGVGADAALSSSGDPLALYLHNRVI